MQRPAAASAQLGVVHARRLREMWRSAGWPCRDAIELDLIAAGMLLRLWDDQGRETLRVTDAGIALLAAARRNNQAALGAHEALVARVCREMQRAGRVVWRGLTLRAPLQADDGRTQWALAMPDVFSIRHTTLEDRTEPAVHEIKVSRADLLSDLRSPTKAAAYRALAGQSWYVLASGIADPDEVPAAHGVLVAGPAGLQVARAAPQRAMRLPFAAWMALARAAAEAPDDAEAQAWLGAGDGDGDGDA